ncbi:helix-turn-helix transcriptional regulator [Halobacillus yeomjeoni]|uniref:Helix-turn-helix transcriptional regulator n=1 Tax=Halobacillus yeomjeoni TaxID=311194 RepID=A0A931HVZ6_9BACI|nr:helix-turn-helix transcriptional regulator [Halobacillus yeomjeoni]MBH0230436.1 helix-turn-helix transcriptional regulator [Halobacillus yeomjeoni]MCA0985321.1 helix-turn-helix transcriptional regulator [Halobacillus yeomjeoni]
MEYGKILRFHRVKQGLTQNQLADGIISPAYLSKIENDQTVPAFEVLELLYERLGLDFNDSSFSHPSKEKLKEWYEAIVLKRTDEAELLKEKLMEQKETFENHHLHIFYELYRIRSFLSKNEVEKAYEVWESIRQYSDTFDEEMKFYYHLVYGLLQYYKGNFEESFQKIMEAKNYVSKLHIENWEYSDLYYHLALSASQAHHVSASVYYADKALELYKNHYDLAKSADCHIILGISYNRLKDYAKSLENYHLARKIATQTKDNQQLKLVYINIAVLESRIGNHQSSIINYKKSLEYSQESETSFDLYELLNIIHGLIIEHFRIKDNEGCKEWIDKGKAKLSSFPSESHEYHFEVYSKLIDNSLDTINYLEKKVIPYFKDKNQHVYVIRYSKFLSDLLEQQRMYKKSSEYLRLAINLLNKHSHLGGIML